MWRKNGFTPELPQEKVDLIYLCFPNNPTGAVATREQPEGLGGLRQRQRRCDPVTTPPTSPSSPRRTSPTPSLRSGGGPHLRHRVPLLLKTRSFTGNRCAYTVVPMELKRDGASPQRPVEPPPVHQSSTGSPYVIQRGAAAIYTPEGKEQTLASIDYYRQNAQVIREGPDRRGTVLLRRRERPLYLAQNAGRDGLLGLLRPAAGPGQRSHHPRRGLRPQRRGFIRLTAFGGAGEPPTG